MTRRTELLLVAALLIVLTAWLTWPQAANLSTQVAYHHDPQFSIWRLAWIHQSLTTDPSRLFDGNIFYPSRTTLAFSDATLLEGLLAAPLFALGISPIAIYNLMLLGGIAGCGLAMFALVRSLTGAAGPAIVAATIFLMAPFRIEHYMHLELQWAMWVPLTFWALHRAVTDASRRHGLLAGVFLWLQIVSSVYYGVFLAITMVVFVIAMAATDARRAAAAIPSLLGGAVVSALLVLPYLMIYMHAATSLEPRNLNEVTSYSARPISYLASPPQNWLWGWTAERWGAPELSLFLGSAAMALALVAVLHRPRQLTLVYAAVAAFAVEMSFGLNGRLYGWILQAAPTFQGLRSPSRFSILACAAIAVLAALGAHTLHRRFATRGGPWGKVFYPVIVAALAVEYSNTGMALMDLPEPGGTVYQVLEPAGSGVIAELPMPTGVFAGRDPDYQYWSLTHWHPILNGYSGYSPRHYIETLDVMKTFPDDESIARLQRLNVQFVIIHRAFYEPTELVPLLLRIASRREFKWHGQFRDPYGEAELFLLER